MARARHAEETKPKRGHSDALRRQRRIETGQASRDWHCGKEESLQGEEQERECYAGEKDINAIKWLTL